MKKYFSIGETAKINNVSIQALRLYDKMGLLKPAYVDSQTNYRYYTNNDKTLIKLTFNAIIIYAFSFVIASINIVNITYYQSTEKPRVANIISTSRGLVFTIVFVIVFPLIVGDIGIWISIILVEICTLLLTVYLIYVKKIGINKS